MHVPVLFDRVAAVLGLAPGRNVLDCTADGGGYAEAILEATAPSGAYVGLDADPSMLEICRKRLEPFGRRVHLRELNFRHLRIAAGDFGKPIHAVVADLGLSSLQLDDPKRGLSFSGSGMLDMRFSPKTSLTAATIVNQWREVEIRIMLEEYGEVRHARRIAAAIVHRRKQHAIVGAGDLGELIASVVRRRGRIHPATTTFQALRIAVNDELHALEEALPQMVDVLAPNGRMAVLSYHSLEDRIVKRFLKAASLDGSLTLVSKKPLVPTREEVIRNPRARSAKLRAAEKVYVK